MDTLLEVKNQIKNIFAKETKEFKFKKNKLREHTSNASNIAVSSNVKNKQLRHMQNAAKILNNTSFIKLNHQKLNSLKTKISSNGLALYNVTLKITLNSSSGTFKNVTMPSNILSKEPRDKKTLSKLYKFYTHDGKIYAKLYREYRYLPEVMKHCYLVNDIIQKYDTNYQFVLTPLIVVNLVENNIKMAEKYHTLEYFMQTIKRKYKNVRFVEIK